MASHRHINEIEGVLNCPICQDVLQDPRNLDCGHTYCVKCLSDWHKQRPSGTTGQIRCPSCNRMTSLPSKGVSTLPRAYALHDVVDKVGQMMRQTSVGTECQLCTDKTQVGEANVFCSQCDKVFCDKCLQRHKSRFPSHAFIRLCDVSEKFCCCPIHRQECLKYLCTTCTDLICTLCALDDSPEGEHQNHSIVPLGEAPSYCEEQLKKEEPLMKEELVKKKALLTEARSVTESINNQGAEAADAVRFLADDIIAAVQQWEERELLKLKTDQKDCLRHWEQIQHKMQQDGERINQQISIIEAIKAKNTQSFSVKDYVDALKHVTRQREESSNLAMQITGPLITKKVTPGLAGTVTTMLEKHDPFVTETHTRKVKLGPNYNYDDVVITRKPTLVWKIAKHGNKEDELRSPVGVSFTHTNGILVCEVENQRLSLFSPVKDGGLGHGEFVQKFVITNLTPKDAVEDEEGRIFVVDAKTNSVLVYDKMGRKITSWGQGIFANPRCLSLMSSNRIVVGDKGKYCVTICKRDGSVVKSFGAKGDGEYQFQFIISIAVDSNDRIIVADRELNSLKIFDQDGSFLFRVLPMTEDGYCKPRFSIELAGIAIDKQDNIYVALHGAHRVLKYFADGQSVSSYPVLGDNEEIIYPCGIAIGRGGFVAVVESSALQKHAALRVFKL